MISEIRFEVCPDREDYRSDAMHHVWRDSLFTYLVLSGAVGAGAAIPGGLLNGLVYGLVMGLTAPVSLYFTQVLAVGNRAKLDDALSPVTYVLSDSSLTIASPNKVTLSPWSDWYRAVETDRVIALRPVGAGVVQVFPKRQLSADVIAELKVLLPRVLNGRVKFRGEG